MADKKITELDALTSPGTTDVIPIVEIASGVTKKIDLATVRKDSIRSISDLRTLDATDHTIECTANTFTITLPTAVGCAGREYEIKNMGTGVITIDTTSSQTIDGTLTAIIALQYGVLKVKSNGANWMIMQP